MQPDRALISGEGVRLDLTRAGVGSRTIAATIDVALQAIALLVVILIDAAAIGSADSAALAAVVLVEVVLVLAGYPIVWEWLTRGRTVGKAIMGLRVVRDDGGPIGLRQALVRGLAGLILEKPGLLFPLTTIAGVLTLTLSESQKRIGDMMAGTIVLNVRAGEQSAGFAPGWVPPPLQPWAMSLDLHRLDDVLALRVRQFLARDLTPAAQFALGEDLRHRVLAVVTPPPPPDAPTRYVLGTVLFERRRRADAPNAYAPNPYQPNPYAPPAHVPTYAPNPYAPNPYAPPAHVPTYAPNPYAQSQPPTQPPAPDDDQSAFAPPR